MFHFNQPPRGSPQAGRGKTEELIPDPRGALTPAEIVERRLTALLDHYDLGISDMRVGRRSSRDYGPASGLADRPAAHDTPDADPAEHQP
jgi:hypothetical protein